jgi:hypothetical protein
LSFFLTTPDRKPRTECGCQPVVSVISEIVVPFGRWSRASTASCFDGAERSRLATTDVFVDLAFEPALRLPGF